MTQPPPPWETLQRLRSRLRRLTWWAGISRCLIALLGGLLIAGWLDWLLRLEDRGIRLLVAGVVWGVVGWTLWRSLIKPLSRGVSDQVLAAQIDRRYPGLGSRLTSAAEFRSANLDPRHGSTELQALVVRQATEDLRGVSTDEILDPRLLSPLIATALCACLTSVVVLSTYPLEASTAMRRMAWPWGQTPWPRNTVLKLTRADGQSLDWNPRDGLRVVRGEPFTVRVENLQGPLPHDLQLQIRDPGSDDPESVPVRMKSSDAEDQASQPNSTLVELVAERDAVEFRLIGGDDHFLPWYSLSAVDPPRISQARIELVPPAYTGDPAVVLPAGVTQVRGWVGSKVLVAAEADRDVAQVELRISDQPVRAVPLDADGRSWSSELTIDRTSVVNFAFVLRDADGFANSQPLQFELRGDPDAVPEIVLQEPSADQWVTPEAVVTLEADARDDVGLRELRRTWQRGEADSVTEPLESLSGATRHYEYRGSWPLSELKLKPGERVIFRLEATDACDVGAPHVGRSAPRTLLVVSAEEKFRELTARIGEIVSDLNDAIDLQQRLSDQAGELQTQLQEVGELQSRDRDVLNRLSWDQRRLATQLGDEVRGLGRRAERLRDEFPANGLADPDADLQLDQLHREMNDLSQSTFPAIDQELTRVTKELDGSESSSTENETEQDKSPSKKLAEQLGTAREWQQRVVTTLQERQAELSRWQSDRNLGDDLDLVADDQQALNDELAKIGAETLARPLSELSPQQRADLNKLADRQRRLAQRAEQLQREFSQLSEKLDERDPLRAADAQDIAEQVQSSGLSMRLQQAGDDVAANRLGAAGPIQQEAAEMFQRLVDQWSNGRADDTEQMLKRAEAAEEMVKSLGDDVETMIKKTAPENLSAAEQSERDALQEQAQMLRKRSERLERELQKLRLQRGADAARQASEQLAAGERALDDEEFADAQDRFSAAREQLANLQEELAREKARQAEKLAQEEAERILGTLQGLKVRQDAVIAETKRLENESQSQGRLTRGQLRTLQDLTVIERDLQQSTHNAAGELTQAVVAKAALESVSRSLERAAERLDQRQTDALTQMLEQDASRRLERIIAAWNRQQEAAGEQGEPEQSATADDPDQPQEAGPPGEAVSLQLQLALLRELQADCLDRTTLLETQRQKDGTFAEEFLPLLTDLAAEQQALIGLARELAELYRQSQSGTGSPPPAADAVDQPQSIPPAEVVP